MTEERQVTAKENVNSIEEKILNIMHHQSVNGRRRNKSSQLIDRDALDGVDTRVGPVMKFLNLHLFPVSRFFLRVNLTCSLFYLLTEILLQVNMTCHLLTISLVQVDLTYYLLK